MLIKGSQLTDAQVAQVKAAFIYRWTIDNPHRERAYRGIDAPTMPLQTDAQWIADHAFHFTRQGRLALNRRYAEPVFMAESK